MKEVCFLPCRGWRVGGGGHPNLCSAVSLAAGVGDGEPRLVLLRVSPTGRRPHVRQLLPGLSPQMSVGGLQAQRWRIPLAVCRLQGRWSNSERRTNPFQCLRFIVSVLSSVLVSPPYSSFHFLFPLPGSGLFLYVCPSCVVIQNLFYSQGQIRTCCDLNVSLFLLVLLLQGSKKKNLNKQEMSKYLRFIVQRMKERVRTTFIYI